MEALAPPPLGRGSVVGKHLKVVIPQRSTCLARQPVHTAVRWLDRRRCAIGLPRLHTLQGPLLLKDFWRL
eukprot:1105058-Amphidinium_carterae.1